MSLVIKKLRSRTGASITFALLLFLVCAVLCSVILAAATASAGRMSKLAENDQRYYAVTSAGELMKDMLDGKTVSVVKISEQITTTAYTNGVAGTPSAAAPEEKGTYLVPDKSGGDALEELDDSSVNITASNIAPVTDTILNDAAYRYTLNKASETPTSGKALVHTFNITSTVENDPVKATVEETLNYDTGDVILTVYNTEGDPFTQRYTFAAEVVDNTFTTATEEKTFVSESVYNIKTTQSINKVTSLTWKLFSVETIAKAVPTAAPATP